MAWMGSLMAKERSQTQKPNSKLFHVCNIPETAKPPGEKSDRGLPGAGGRRGENGSQRDSREHLHMMEMCLRQLDRGAGEMNGIKIHQTVPLRVNLALRKFYLNKPYLKQ